MCGIAGQIALTASTGVDPAIVAPTAALLAHRGPDDWGWVMGAGRDVLLLNTRLSIVDVAGGRQPIGNEDGTVWVTFNGECYGFDAERRWLETRGHRFRTRTDTEVLVHLYEEFGERFVERLRGEFAFALHDRRAGVCLVVRDRFGIKPLVYTEQAGRLAFASEVKALFADPSIGRSLDREQIFHVLGGVFLPDRTIFAGVRHVEPGTYLRIEVGRSYRSVRYWTPPFDAADSARTPRAEAEAVAAFAEKLREATRLRLHGDVDVGAYLSGGVDSAAIVQAVRETSRPLHTFTVGFEPGPHDESEPALDVSRRLGTTHHVMRVGAGDLSDAFLGSLWHGETPVPNAHGAAKYLLSRLTRSVVKVVITGEGADELLAGYPQFRHQQLLEACRRSPRDREAAAALAQFAAQASVFSGTVPISRYPAYDDVVARFGAYPYALTRVFAYQRRIRPLLSRAMRTAVAGADSLAALEQALGPRVFAGLDPVRASQAYLFRTELPGYILSTLGDRQEMAHGVEGRVPFLDHELVELALTFPTALLLRPDRNKHPLRCFVETALPASAGRAKQIFLAPSTRVLGLDRAGSPLAQRLSRPSVRDAGFMGPWPVALLRQALARARPGSRLHAVAEAVLVFTLSLQVLDELLCRDFTASAARYAPDPATFDVAEGNVETSAGARDGRRNAAAASPPPA